MATSLWFTTGWPLALWGLLLCPLLLLAVIRSRAVLSRVNFFVVTTLRVLAVALIVLALADARVHWPTDELAVATIIDDSASLSAAERDALTKRAAWLARTRTEVAWVDLSTRPGEAQAHPGGLAARVSAAQALLPRDRLRRVIVATDGRDAPERLLPAIRQVADDGVRVFLLSAGERPPIDQVALSGVEVPRLIRAGETAAVTVQITSLSSQRATLQVLLDDVVVTNGTVELTSGRTTHTEQVPFRAEGVHRLSARVLSTQDTLSENNTWTSLVRVITPPRVLLVHQTPVPEPPLAKVLRDSRLQVDVIGPAQVAQVAPRLGRYQLVVTDEVDPALIDDPSQRAIRGWVEEGGGLITVTGVNAVRSEPQVFRELEPVIPPRAIPETPPMEIILVIDRSGSMSGQRIYMARQAGVAAVQAMRADSRVGLVAFSGSPDTVIPPVDMSRSQWLIGVIASLTSGGGTDIAAALNAAGSIMSNDPRFLHHIILLSDGVSSTQPAVWEAQMLAARGISISTISLGQRNSLMADIAALGQGRYHVANDPSQLPQLFVREARYRQAPPHREIDFRPEVAETMAFLDGVDFAADPEIAGYVLAETRPEARTVLRSPEGDPILAHWRVGDGQVASFTSTTSGRWADRWRTGQSFGRLFSQMGWELLRERVEGELEMRVDPDPRDPELRVITVATNDIDQEEAPVVDLARGTSVQEIKPVFLVQRAPGLWQATVERGSGFVSSAAPRADEDPVAAVAVDNPYPEELSAFGPDVQTLSLLAEAGRGQVVDALESVLAPGGGDVSTSRRLRLPLLILALLLYLVSVLLLRLPQNARAAASRLRRGRRKARSPEREPSAKNGAA